MNYAVTGATRRKKRYDRHAWAASPQLHHPMSALTHLTLLHTNEKAAAALRFGFEREGTVVATVQDAESLQKSIDEGSQLIITGGKSKEDAEKKLALIEGVLAGATSRVRVLYFGNSISREDALGSGAHEFLTPPAFIRDVVTLSKLMATPMERRTQSISGELSEHFGLFYLVRALGMVNYTGVLTLLRGLRRGELRFYKGEVTSGQMGSLHGLAALHQSLLWTHARFDLRDEQTVHRRQIPLERAELLRDCERFLREIRSVAGGLSPSAVLERDKDKDRNALPSQVDEVLQLFDGTCSVADVIEDSPYRVFETLRIACRLAEQGFVHRANKAAPKHLMHTALAIEEWLVSGAVTSESSSEEATPPGPAKGKPASPPQKGRKKQRGRKRTKLSSSAPASAVPSNEQSWSDLLPTLQTSGDMAQVVPSTSAVGEISVGATRPSSRASRVGGTEPPPMPERERLEEKGGVASLAKIFVDESLGAEELGSDGKRISSTDDDGVPREKDSWDEKTAPAIPISLAAAETQPVEEPPAEEPPAEEPPAEELPVERTAVSKADSTDKKTSEKGADKNEPASTVAKRDEEASASSDSSSRKVTSSESQPKGQVEQESASSSSSGWTAEEASAAHTIVAQTAKDASLAVAAVLKAATTDPSVLKAPAATETAKRADSKSEKDAQDVADLASAAEAAGNEASDFSVEEEAFFDRGHAEAKVEPVRVESFEDLDEGYEIPKTFWQRFLSNPDMRQRKKKKKR